MLQHDRNQRGKINTDTAVRLEQDMLHGKAVEADALLALSAEEIAASPLLLLADGERKLRAGDLLGAQESMQTAIAGLMNLSLSRPVLNAMAGLACIMLRIGRQAEAEPLLVFLRGEQERGEAECGGAVAHAIAVSQTELVEASRWYKLALRAYDCDGDGEGAAAALLDWLNGYADQFVDEDWEERLVELRQRIRTRRMAPAVLAYAESLRSLAAGDPQAAWSLLERCGYGSLPYPHDRLAGLLAVRAALAAGHPEAENMLAQAALRGYEDDVDLQLQTGWASLKLLAAGRSGTADAAELRLLKARVRSLRRLLPIRSGLSSADAAEEDQRQAQARVAAGHPASEASPAAAPVSAATPAAAPVSVFAEPWRAVLFGGLGLHRPGIELRSFRWKRRKTPELLVYLLLQPNFAANREQAAEALFPDCPADKLANRFYVVAHELKHALNGMLGTGGSLILRDSTVRLAEGLFDLVDVEQHEAMIRVGDRLWPTDRALAADMYVRAIELYGLIVPELPYADWLDRLREQAAERQARIYRRLGRHAETEARPEEAELRYREWIELRPLEEEAHQHLIRFLVGQDRHAEALAAYERLAELLRGEWDESPMPETTRLLRGGSGADA